MSGIGGMEHRCNCGNPGDIPVTAVNYLPALFAEFNGVCVLNGSLNNDPIAVCYYAPFFSPIDVWKFDLIPEDKCWLGSRLKFVSATAPWPEEGCYYDDDCEDHDYPAVTVVENSWGDCPIEPGQGGF